VSLVVGRNREYLANRYYLSKTRGRCAAFAVAHHSERGHPTLVCTPTISKKIVTITVTSTERDPKTRRTEDSDEQNVSLVLSTNGRDHCTEHYINHHHLLVDPNQTSRSLRGRQHLPSTLVPCKGLPIIVAVAGAAAIDGSSDGCTGKRVTGGALVLQQVAAAASVLAVVQCE